MSEQEINIRITATDETGEAWESAGEGLEYVEGKAKDVQKSSVALSNASKDLAVGLSGVATGALALYQGYDRLERSQYAVQQANLLVKSSLNSVDDAQRRYNDAVEKFGEDSPQARAALADLQVAQERLALAQEKANLVQNDLSNAYMSFAVSILPASISMASSMGKVIESLNALRGQEVGALVASKASYVAHAIAQGASTAATQVMTTAQAALNAVMSVNPIFLVVAALAALTAGLAWAYQNCEWFRNGVNWLWEQISVYLQPAIDAVTLAISNLGKVWDAVLGAMRWVWDHTIAPILDALNWVWNTLTGASTSVTAGTTADVETSIPGFASGFEGVVSKPTLMLVGEAGPEAVSITPIGAPPIPKTQSGSMVSINAPLVYIEGSADEKTAKLAGEIVMRQLRRL